MHGECSVSHLPLHSWKYAKCIHLDKAVGIGFDVASTFLNDEFELRLCRQH